MNIVPEMETVDNLEEIYAWIDQIPFSRPKRNITRDFSDAVLMAELLKRYYPRYVDVHNYIGGNSIAKKVDNWCTLNRKVLSKIDMKLGKEVINQLANSQQGIIEKVLMDLRTKILKDCNANRDSSYLEYEEDGKGETLKPIMNPEDIANKTVPRHMFARLKQELQEKNEAINILNHKVSHLESLMKVKDERIAQLTSQVIKPLERNVSLRSHVVSNGTSNYKSNNS